MSNSDIAKRIKDSCRNKKVTIKSVLEACGINRNFIYDLEHKDAAPSTEKVKMIADYLGVTTDYLLGRDTESHRVALLAPKDYDQLTEEERDFINSTVEAVLKNRKKTE